MSNLIIHPRDNSTIFLSKIYKNIPDKTVITGGISKIELMKLIEIHERVIILGHGSSYGLLAVGQFPYAGSYIIDETMVTLLSQKKDNIYIWCNADQFVRQHQLSGFFCGMFISEIQEAWYFNFYDLDKNAITESNDVFAHIVSKYIDHPLDVLHEYVLQEYGLLAQTNPIAQFNLKRLFLNVKQQYDHFCKLSKSLNNTFMYHSNV